jgi:hypothetical protein
MSTEKGREETQKPTGGLVLAGQGVDLALQNAVRLSADATTDAISAGNHLEPSTHHKIIPATEPNLQAIPRVAAGVALAPSRWEASRCHSTGKPLR